MRRAVVRFPSPPPRTVVLSYTRIFPPYNCELVLPTTLALAPQVLHQGFAVAACAHNRDYSRRPRQRSEGGDTTSRCLHRFHGLAVGAHYEGARGSGFDAFCCDRGSVCPHQFGAVQELGSHAL